MIKISMEFDTNNAAFEGYNFANEAERIIRKEMDRCVGALLRGEEFDHRLYDHNGNPVGSAYIEVDYPESEGEGEGEEE